MEFIFVIHLSLGFIDLDMSGKFEDDEVKVMKETAIPVW